MSRLDSITAWYGSLGSTARLRLGIGIMIVLSLAILYSTLGERTARLQRTIRAREADVAELLVLRQRYREASADAQRLTNRLAAVRPDDTPAKLIEEIGIKGKGGQLQIRPVKGEERSGAVEDAAEVKIDGLTANEAVNLLYRLERGTKPVLLKRLQLKTRFDDSARLDLTLTLALLKPAPAGGR